MNCKRQEIAGQLPALYRSFFRGPWTLILLVLGSDTSLFAEFVGGYSVELLVSLDRDYGCAVTVD